jgi:hypothetical protein
MTTSKKKKSSTLRIVHPYALNARTVTFHRKDNRSVSSRTTTRVTRVSQPDSQAASSSQIPETSLSLAESHDPFSEYIENIQHGNLAEDSVEGTEEPKQQARTKVMEDWLKCRDTYL